MSVVPPPGPGTARDNRTVHLAEPNETPQLPPAPELPGFYGENRLVLLVRDPTMLFAAWEVTCPAYQAALERTGGHGEHHLALRVLELAPQARQILELDVSGTSSWYIRHDRPGTVCRAQLGVRCGGRFEPIVESAPVHIPTGRESDHVDAEWATIEEVLERSRQGHHSGSSYFL